MQVKIVIGTISFMLTMVILGFAALREPARLEEYSAMAHGRSIEVGAHIYEQNCATCHGEEGRAETCHDPTSGDEIPCIGFPLNSSDLICGDSPAKLESIGYDGTKDAFIISTIAGGRPGTQMPVWSERFGGPMRDDQIENVANFVLNWGDVWKENGECRAPVEWPVTVEEFLAMDSEDFVAQPGDAANGEALYTSYTCNVCHGDLSDAGSAAIGPWLGDIAERGGDLVEGSSAEQYLYDSILYPNDYIAEECPNAACTGPPSTMRQSFASDIGNSNMQDMADLLAYIMGQ